MFSSGSAERCPRGGHELGATKRALNTFKNRPKIVDLGPQSATKPDEGNPTKTRGGAHKWHKQILIEFGPVSGCFDHHPKLLNCQIAQPCEKLGRTPPNQPRRQTVMPGRDYVLALPDS